MKVFNRFSLVMVAVLVLLVLVLGEAPAFGGRCGGGLFSRLRGQSSASQCGQSSATASCATGNCGQASAQVSVSQFPFSATGVSVQACPTCPPSSAGLSPQAVGGPIVNPNWTPIQIGQPLPTAPLSPAGIQCRMVLVNGQWVQICK